MSARLPPQKRVVVIGGGIAGLACAWYAAQDGHVVTLLDRGGPDTDRCSLGNAGMIVPSHFIPLASPGAVLRGLRSLADPRSPLRVTPRADPDYLRWCWQFLCAARASRVALAAPALRDLALLGRRGYEALTLLWPQGVPLAEHGLLMLARSAHGMREERRVAAMAQRLGMPVEILDRDAAAALEPGVDMAIVGAVRYPLDAHTVPQRVVATLVAGLADAGVDLHWNTEVTGLERKGARVSGAVTDAGVVGGDEFVIAGGAWSAALARDIDLPLPLLSGKGYSFMLPAPRARLHACAVLTEDFVAVTPMGDALRFAGTLELCGLDRSIDQRRVAAMVDAIPRYYPQFGPADFAGITPWAGLRPCTPDGLPFLGRTRRADNVLLATGHAMMGVTLAPASGRIISDLIAGRDPSVPISLYSPDRFA
ncbi:MAG TPA: FAD-dependent oxidoreductase [Steroidobacteraceae bacterium]|nr:FAD-dependent oxidoreductase [Steroidobacteraceae bacterium]HNS27777.1 FAD-dependent oxidoreductase [Steroidobacteraceae bacterium]